jgi:hypothetical protein
MVQHQQQQQPQLAAGTADAGLALPCSQALAATRVSLGSNHPQPLLEVAAVRSEETDRQQE